MSMKELGHPARANPRAPLDAVAAHCGEKDRAALPALRAKPVSGTPELELQVERAVEAAWKHFREGNLPLAERTLGQVPEADVFTAPTSRSAGTRWARWILVGMAAALLLLYLWDWWQSHFSSSARP
jgi:hypothetical protein